MQSRTINFFITLIFLLFCSNLSAQEYIFDAQRLTPEDGLPNLLNTDITKDKAGFLWGTTPNGFYRYNGYEFKNYKLEKNNSSLKYIQQIKIDEQNNLWLFSTDRHNPLYPEGQNQVSIDIFNTQTEKIISFDKYCSEQPFLPNDIVLSKIIDPKNRFWISTKQGALFLFQDGVFKKIFEKKGVFFQYITVDATDKIWLGYNQIMIHITMDGKIVENMALPERVNGIWTGVTNQVWLATNFWTDTTIQRTPNDFHITLWSKTGNGQLATFDLVKNGVKIKPEINGGIFIHRSQEGFWYIEKGKQLQSFDENGNWLFNFHSKIGEDIYTGFSNYYEEGATLWLLTPIGLIKTKISDNPFKLIHKAGKFSACRGITEDESGNIYFLNKNLYRWNPRKDSLTNFGIFGQTGLTYFDGFLWSGTLHKNLDFGRQFDLKTEQKYAYPLQGDTAQLAYGTLRTEKPHQLLVGLNKGLCYVDIQKKTVVAFTQYNEFNILKTSMVYYLHRNQNGIWLATSNGIFLMSEEAGILRHYSKESGDLPYNHIRHIHEDAAGIFWLATKGGGIIKWQPALENKKKSISKQLTKNNGLSHINTHGIYEDGFGKLWIPSDLGLMRIDRENLHVETFLIKDGLPDDNEFNSTSHYQAKDSTLYFGGLGGLISFDPSLFVKQTNEHIPFYIITLTILEANKKEATDITKLLQSTREIVLQPTDKFLELQFSLLDYDNIKHHQYEYKLEGYNDNWEKTRGNYLRINSLDDGTYTLKLRSKNNRSNWSKELELTIIQLKPFYLQWWFLLLMVLISLLSFRLMLIRRESNLRKRNKLLEARVQERTRALEKMTKARTRFFNNITHEIRTPLTLIIGPAEQLLTKTLAKSYKEQIQLIKKNATDLLNTINQLLDISKIESGTMTIECSEGDIIAFCEDLVQRFHPLASQKQQQLSFVHDLENWTTYFDKKKLSKIIYNLLSNAHKFTDKTGSIQLNISKIERKGKDYIELIVKDTGDGISAELLPKIFDRFYQVDASSTRKHEGTGIGLSLVKELIEIQGGIIEVESQLGEGTIFSVMIPVLPANSLVINADADKFEEENLLGQEENKAIFSSLSKTGPAAIKNNFDILLIEDNTEMRSYIKSCITGNYSVDEAADGAEGIGMAIEKVPDLIISDIMMPNKNGYEVTKAIRSNINTSHIPIILLTAKTTLDSRLKGLDRGADAYLTKPFSAQELNLRIRKLLESRALLQQRFQGVTNIEKETPKFAFEQEDNFIQAVKTIIENNIEKTTLNGAFIGKNLGMSRMQLHRKLKAITNQSAREFITEYRLQKALVLLKKGRSEVSEVAYQTGFNTPGYFSKLFKKRFGITPSEAITLAKK